MQHAGADSLHLADAIDDGLDSDDGASTFLTVDRNALPYRAAGHQPSQAAAFSAAVVSCCQQQRYIWLVLLLLLGTSVGLSLRVSQLTAERDGLQTRLDGEPLQSPTVAAAALPFLPCAPERIMIVQSDNRVAPLSAMPPAVSASLPPAWSENDNRFLQQEWYTLAQLSIYMWSQAHNYSYTFLDGSGAVESTGRVPAWSKVLANRQMMEERPDIEWFLWVDSDIMLSDISCTIDELLRAGQTTQSQYEAVCGEATRLPEGGVGQETNRRDNSSGIHFIIIPSWLNIHSIGNGVPQPFGTGFWLVRNSVRGREILHHWWTACPHPGEPINCLSQHPWEQWTFNTFTQGVFRSNILTLDALSLAGIPESSKLTHVWSGAQAPHRLPEARVSAAYFATRNVFREWHNDHVQDLNATATVQLITQNGTAAEREAQVRE